MKRKTMDCPVCHKRAKSLSLNPVSVAAQLGVYILPRDYACFKCITRLNQALEEYGKDLETRMGMNI